MSLFIAALPPPKGYYSYYTYYFASVVSCRLRYTVGKWGLAMNDFQFPLFAQALGRRQWRDAVNHPPAWEPDDDELNLGPRTDLRDGIYIVSVHEGTPDDWIHLARKATIAAQGQHPGPDFEPGNIYDSGVAVRHGRVVGAVMACLEARNHYRWIVALKPDGAAYTYEEVACPDCDPGVDHPGRATRDQALAEGGYTPAIFTIWVHPEHRRQHIGGQLVRAITGHLGLAPDRIGYRLPLSREAVGMVRSLGLREVIGCF
jgi:ribosomal protein S18 acetylase RimI-like enzyme